MGLSTKDAVFVADVKYLKELVQPKIGRLSDRIKRVTVINKIGYIACYLDLFTLLAGKPQADILLMIKF